MPRKRIIGLAGGIGAGKSTVARILAEHGLTVIDSDRLGREELTDPQVVETLVGWYGEGIRGADGGICRRALGAIIFEDPVQRKRVEQLLHPRIERRRRTLIDQLESDDDVRAIVLDSPLLFEAGLDQECDVILFVDSTDQERRQRVAASRGWSEQELSRREKQQKPLDFKRSQADHVVVNDAGLQDLRRRIERLLTRLLTPTPPRDVGE